MVIYLLIYHEYSRFNFYSKVNIQEDYVKSERLGELFIIFLSFFEGWFPIVTMIILQTMTPVFAYSFTLMFVIMLFLTIVLLKKKASEFFYWSAWPDLLLSSFFITLMFVCLFSGLVYTTVSNMAVLIFLQVLFSFLYFNVLGNEPFSRVHLLGAVLMTCGALIILFPKQLHLNIGDLLILLAAAIAPIANLFQKRALKLVSSETILAFRSIIALPVLLFMACALEPEPDREMIMIALPWLAINGLLLMGLSKIFWLESIHRISITKASAMAAFVPVFTLLFAYLTLNEIPQITQIIGIVPILIGGLLITRNKQN